MAGLTQEQVTDYIVKSRYRLPELKMGKPTRHDVRLITETARNFGLDYNGPTESTALAYRKTDYSLVLMCSGEYGIRDECELETESGMKTVRSVVFNRTREDLRLKEIARQLIEKEEVRLYDGLGVEYLHFALKETSDELFFGELKSVADGLPIYYVAFGGDGGFDIKEMGTV